MTFLKVLILLFLAFTMLDCSSPDLNTEDENNMEEGIIDSSFFQMPSTIADKSIVLYDTISNRIYFVQKEGATKIICYDYKNLKVISEAFPSTDIDDLNYGIGRYKDEIEIYLGNGSIIEIYDGDDLTLKNSISTEGSISTIQFEPPNLIFIGTCNRMGTSVYNRDTKELISKGSPIDQCLGIMSFRYESGDTIGLISEGYNSSGARLTLDIFDKSGNFLDNITSTSNSPASWTFMRKGEHSDYFISNRSGKIISKKDLSLIGGIAPSFSADIITNHDGSKIYSISDRRIIKVYDYPGLKEITRHNVTSHELVNDLHHAENLFIDEGKLIIILYKTFNGLPETYILKIDLL